MQKIEQIHEILFDILVAIDELCEKHGITYYLDSGTLTPMLKNLESKGYVKRTRSSVDERVLEIKITQLGEQLKEKADSIQHKIPKWSGLNCCEMKTLYNLLQNRPFFFRWWLCDDSVDSARGY